MTNTEKKKRQHKKELKSLRNKMGKNIIWFDSLTEKNQFNVLFYWKKEKHFNKLTIPKIIHQRPISRSFRYYSPIHSMSSVTIRYPASLKYFILRMRRKYKPSISRLREVSIDLLLNKK